MVSYFHLCIRLMWLKTKSVDFRHFTLIMVQTAEQKAVLRSKKALESGNSAFKPRGKANKATFEKMKQEFDETRSHVTKQADRVIDEIKPLATFFSGSESTDPQTRIDARLLQNSLNVKANKNDRD